MRNLQEYPITLDEKLKVLEDFLESVNFEHTQLFGDIRPTVLREVIRDVRRIHSPESDRFIRAKALYEWRVRDATFRWEQLSSGEKQEWIDLIPKSPAPKPPVPPKPQIVEMGAKIPFVETLNKIDPGTDDGA